MSERVRLNDFNAIASKRPEVSFLPVSPGGLTGNGKLPFAPLAEALANVPEEPPWTWDGYLAPGAVTLLAGRPKVGKSTLVFGLIAALLEGKTYADRQTRPSGVLLLSEEREGTLAEKAHDWSLSFPSNVSALTDEKETGPPVHLLLRYQANAHPWPEIVAEAAAYCDAHALSVLVVDTWDKWTGIKGDAENNAGTVLEALEPLTQAAGAYNLAVLVVSHQRKAAGEFGEAVRGSNALTGGVDIVAELERPKAEALAGEGERVLLAVSRYAGTPESLVVALTDDGYEARGDALAARGEAERAQVLKALGELGEATYSELHVETGLTTSTVRRRLSELGEQVGKRGKGRRGDPFRFLRSEGAS